MFWNIYSKRLLSSIRNKDQLIWIWAFPLIMSTLFYFCLSAVSQSDNLEPVPVGVITDTAYEENQMFSQVLEQVGSGEDAILKVTEYAQRDKADSALEKGDIDGYILIRENTPQLVVKQDGMNQTILKSFLDRYVQTEGNIRAIMEKNPGYALDLEEIMGGDTLTEEISLSSQPYSPVINFLLCPDRNGMHVRRYAGAYKYHISAGKPVRPGCQAHDGASWQDPCDLLRPAGKRNSAYDEPAVSIILYYGYSESGFWGPAAASRSHVPGRHYPGCGVWYGCKLPV